MEYLLLLLLVLNTGRHSDSEVKNVTTLVIFDFDKYVLFLF